MLDRNMPVFVSLLRGVNLAGRNMIRMPALVELYNSLGLENPISCIQSGNVVFRSRHRNAAKLAERIEEAIEQTFGFRPRVVLRTPEQLRSLIERNPFASRQDVNGSKLLVTFLEREPPSEGSAKLLQVEGPEEIHLDGAELFIYYPDGVGKSKLLPSVVERFLKTTGTGRNWNTVLKLLAIAESLE